MLIGYARVSTHEQNLNLQEDALDEAGCSRIFKDTISGSTDERPGLRAMFSHLREKDTLIVWRLDRLGRSLQDLLGIIERLKIIEVEFRSLTENIDTSSSTGKLVFSIFGAIAEFEKDLIKERTLAGLASARARGRKGGRRLEHSDKKILTAEQMAASSSDSIIDVCSTLGISRSTYYRRLKQINQ